MYKVNYTKLAIMADGTNGNIPQGAGVAFMDCNIPEIFDKLRYELAHVANKNKYFPLIDNIAAIDGHIVR